MSGLYNMVYGVHPLAGTLLQALGIDHHEVPRFRDCFPHIDRTIVIYTRTGGGNREEYAEQNQQMATRAFYIRDEDDSFDSTYALFHFEVPEKIKKAFTELIEAGHGVDPAQRWMQTIEEMKKL